MITIAEDHYATQKLVHVNHLNNPYTMTAYTFIQLNQSRIQNIDGCLTDEANITIMESDGRLAFYYFEGGIMVDPRS
jgi:hypothetical protein